MQHIIDARGLACPQPVLLAKKALEAHHDVIIIVDNDIALENVRRLGLKLECNCNVTKKKGGIYEIQLLKAGSAEQKHDDNGEAPQPSSAGKAGPFVVVVAENRMGRGDDELGYVLIRSFIHTLLALKPLPDKLIFYNTGVKLTVRDSDVIEDLQQLEKVGVQILVCGTCTNYFEISDSVGVGTISNMYDIAETMAGASKLIIP